MLQTVGPLARADLADRLGLARSSITTIVAELIADGTLVELESRIEDPGYRGRPRTLLSVSPQAATGKRKPNAEERRRELCDAAIDVLAEEGARGLTHRKVEQRAELPDGTTSSYFPTRSALLRAISERVAELDRAEFISVATDAADTDPPVSTLSLLAEMAMRSASGPALNRSRARYELSLHASRDPEVMGAFTDAIGQFIALSEEAVRLAQPGAALDRQLIEEQAYAVTTFINGVMLRLALGERTVDSAAHLGELLHALVAGIAVIRERAT
ncbi:TetR/AcrR family transcriptional regulator [Mycolicibacterium sphagni]|uniref:TetR/AcrR family transcriptional regulator n=1 Tax=Mycolicibacterium sphagni TaxID=1786 RepID=UPI001F3DBA0A|nr:TetR family transcriptional regulator [Mycolicibacterium sphagni]